MIGSDFEFRSAQQYRIRILENKVKKFESGEKYTEMKTLCDRRVAAAERENRALKKEIERLHKEHQSALRKWFEASDDMEKQFQKDLNRKDRILFSQRDEISRLKAENEELREKVKRQNEEKYQLLTELEEEKGKNRTLRAQIDRDYENSGIPSSLKPSHPKIPNSRERTGRKPGGQPGHPGHRRKRLEPTEPVHYIPPTDELLEDPFLRPTGRMAARDMADIRVLVNVVRYETPEFKNTKTGKLTHAPFPDGLANETNYGPGVKSLAYLLNSYCGVSLDKTKEVISSLTGGQIDLSKGMLNHLAKEVSERTEQQRKELFADMLLAPVMNADFTSYRVNGKIRAVLVCCANGVALYFANDHKGEKGVKGTPLEHYLGIVVHDHDPTMYKYGTAHQECLAHVLRYLKGSIENEPDRTWNQEMRSVIPDMIRYRRNMKEGDIPDPGKVTELEERYDKAIEKAENEYEDVPADPYYRDGFNLYRRMKEYRTEHLLFLHDVRVPYTNSVSERSLRVLKRKMHQTMGGRSMEYLQYLCDGLSIFGWCKKEGKNIYEYLQAVFATSGNIH